MLLPNQALVAVMDGGHFLLMANQGDEAVLDLRCISESRHGVARSRDLGRQRQGRFHGVGSTSGGPERPDLHERAETRHVLEALSELKLAVLQRSVRHLVIVADPDTLGELRPHYDNVLQTALLAEIPRDLTNLPIPEIEAAIVAWHGD